MDQFRGDRRGSPSDLWPALPLAEWQDTYVTVHMWTQIVGKIALAQAPSINHWWQVALRVTARGLTTLPLPCGGRTVQFSFDFIDHRLRIVDCDGGERSIALRSFSVADFYREVMDSLASLGLGVRIWTTPVETESRIPFEQDRQHASYDPQYTHRV
jgi:hypothetical protein